MEYSVIVDVYEKIEATTKRLEMTDLLVSLLSKTPKEIIDKVIYLTQGKLYPDYVGIELGIAEKLAMRALAIASGLSLKEIENELKKTGDIGIAAELALKKRRTKTLMEFFGAPVKIQKLTVQTVYETLEKIAKATGEGAQDTKVKLLVSLLRRASPKEAKYLLRTVTGKLRLGIADMTILDALAIAFCKTKEVRPIIERAYNISSDLGAVAKTLAYEGLEGVKKFKITVGRPIRPMLAERLSSPEEILEKLGGRCAAEYKYDGERIQAHKKGDEVILFSRRLENITHHYPDACELIRTNIKAEEAIVEGECVAINPETGEMQPFQELMHRRRKYGIEEAMKLYPVSLFMFDALYVDGEDLTIKPYPQRREILRKIVEEGDRIKLSSYKIIDNAKDLEEFFLEAVEEGCEGLVCKSLNPDSVYQAGSRGWLWIKYKRDYKSEMIDTVDLVVVGAFWGKGRRAGTYGALLMAAYDPEKDMFRTICKVGSGFTDEDLKKLPEILEPYKIPHIHSRVDSKIEADVWFVPAVVLEIIGAEITLSPLHTCGLNAIREGAGLAIRFPRFTGRYRTDKKPEDATTVKEIIEMYKAQLKKVTE
ncbi:MAG: ATP-dependent DNA ligase [Candidatus Methanomethylicota archaeon]|uniref:DNA ligase n=1 Tax=Thermoproteota archaeon TaxID=2056631 RepID=A0A497EWD2_9CREN|nr:MAG: ATP-dependent DNA ligase [Candidatus Verstraetearchaeota archaeon]